MKKILVVDDDVLFARLIKDSLKDVFDVRLASDVLAAMAAIDDDVPDLIILDILMPASNGLNLLNELVSYADTSQIPVIICSSIAGQLNQDLMQASGVVKILDKTTMQPSDIKAYAKQALGAYE